MLWLTFVSNAFSNNHLSKTLYDANVFKQIHGVFPHKHADDDPTRGRREFKLCSFLIFAFLPFFLIFTISWTKTPDAQPILKMRFRFLGFFVREVSCG